MNDETRDDSNTEAAETGPRGGERLREAREEQQITLLEIAKELHLDEHKVRALERNEFDVLGAPVFAKGHLKKYSELVGVDERDVLADYHELTRSAGMPPVVGKRRRPGSELSPGPWIILVVVIIAAAFAYWWFTAGRSMTASSVTPATETEVPAPAPLQPEAPAASEPVAETEPEPEPEAATAVEAVEETAEPVADEPEATPAPAEPTPVGSTLPDGIVLTLSFAEDCWTEVTDSSGQRLFFDLGRAGTTVNVEGVAPLSVLLGSADGVSIRLDGEDYTIRADQRRGRTARLTLP